MVSQVDITPIALDGLYLLTVAGELDIATADRFIVDVVDWAASRRVHYHHEPILTDRAGIHRTERRRSRTDPATGYAA